MILLVDQNATIRKKLCDMLNRERIIAVAAKQQVLEALVQHRNKLNVFVASATSLNEILSGETILKLCTKLSITFPPIVALYRPTEIATIKSVSDNNYRFEFVEFDEKNTDFPDAYAKALKSVYPEINIDMQKAKQVWLRTDATQDLIDVREWLNKSGISKETHEPALLSKTKKTKEDSEADETNDYKKLYLDMKEKYDKLVAEFEELKNLLEG